MVILKESLFGASKIPFNEITQIERNSPQLIVYAIPVLAFFTILEIGYSWYLKNKTYKLKESVGSALVGFGNLGINLVFKIVLIYGAVWIYNLVPWRIALNWWTIIPCYIIFDFFSYWSHRISHFNRFFWATHVVHHSAESYNLTVSFRLSWLQNLKVIFFLPVAFLAFHPVIFFVASQIAVLFQFWVHTEYIRKLHPIVEFIFATPSNHRVHHGSQEKYLDKNFAATFILWDRIFGTYCNEDEQPDYGLTNKIGNRLNPIYLNFHEFKDMAKDVRQAKGLKEKLFYTFSSPTKIHQRKTGKLPAVQSN
jgi:sterol desaturase/sphingolipid hydroxylase (fatty acid hydroxylase superfamily)